MYLTKRRVPGHSVKILYFQQTRQMTDLRPQETRRVAEVNFPSTSINYTNSVSKHIF